MAKKKRKNKTARLKAKRKAKIRRGRQQQRQDPRLGALRKNKKRMKIKKLRGGLRRRK